MSSRYKLSYSRRLFLWLLGYSLLMVICFVFFQYHREKQFKAEELNAQLQIVNANVLADFSENESLTANYIKGKQPFDEIRISIITTDGTVVYDNSLDTLPQSNHLSREEIAEAVMRGEGYTIRRHSESTGGNYFYSARKGERYIVRTAVPYTLPVTGLLKADYGFLWFMGTVTFIMLIIGYFITRHEGETEEQVKSQMRRQLTNNINHELKTPLASIQVCVETLTDHPSLSEEKRSEFLNRCLVNVQRLRHLLDDVSTITRMDDGGSVIEREPINLKDVIKEVCDDLRQQAENKGMLIENGVNDDVMVNGNLSLLASVFHNLVDNAIAYSGGSEIEIKEIRHSADSVTITVEDDGSGVAPQHLSRLFERFYRVDKGRSRQAGGTGLGLSIVKNAVLIHGGEITVANKPTGGLIFTLTLPTAI